MNNNQVAIFRVSGSDQLYAIDNYDPIGQANVLSRGLLAHLKDQLTVASPLYKHHFRLTDGVCLEDAEVKVATYPVRVEQDQVLVGISGE